MGNIARPVGPVDVAVIAFDDARFDGSIAAAISDLVSTGTVRLLDMILVSKDADGVVSLVEVTDIDGDGINDLVALKGDIPGLLSETDAGVAVEAMPNGSAVAMIAWENTWLVRAGEAIRSSGGSLVAFERITAEDVAAVLDSAE